MSASIQHPNILYFKRHLILNKQSLKPYNQQSVIKTSFTCLKNNTIKRMIASIWGEKTMHIFVLEPCSSKLTVYIYYWHFVSDQNQEVMKVTRTKYPYKLSQSVHNLLVASLRFRLPEGEEGLNRFTGIKYRFNQAYKQNSVAIINHRGKRGFVILE